MEKCVIVYKDEEGSYHKELLNGVYIKTIDINEAHIFDSVESATKVLVSMIIKTGELGGIKLYKS